MAKVFLGVGHGGNDSGAVANGFKEKDMTLKIANACKAYLEANGISVKMSRYRDENDPVNEEASECNAYNPSLAIDIHINAGGGDGFEVFHTVSGGTGKTLAQNIEKEVVASGQNSRGVKTRKNSSGKDYYAFIRKTKCPAVICELGFIDNLNDLQAFDEDHELKAFGEAYARGILITLGMGSGITPPSNTTNPGDIAQAVDGNFTTGTYTITASDLIVRNKPAGAAVGYSGLTEDGKKHDTDKDGALNEGTRITVKEVRALNEDIWGRCPSGWVCLKQGNKVYAVKDGSSTGSAPSSSERPLGTYEVTASDLSVRVKAGTQYRRKTYAELTESGKVHDYDKDGCLNKGTRVTVKEWQNGWARIPSGWVSGDYLKKV